MNEAQYFEQFIGDTTITIRLGMTGGHDYFTIRTVIEQWQKNAQVERPQSRFAFEYLHNPGSPFGEHQFFLLEIIPA